jgi:hypothetical protein
MRAVFLTAIVTGLLLALAPPGATAQPAADENWNPFKSGADGPASRRTTPPADRAKLQGEPRVAVPNRSVESTDLPPVMAPDASALPLELWRGLDLAAIERLLAAIDAPPRSPALHQLWRRMLLASARLPAGAGSPDQFTLVRVDALYRSGLLHDMVELADQSSQLGQILRARRDIGIGAREAGCDAIKAVTASAGGLPKQLKGEMQLLASYCAAAAGDVASASLAASIAREEGAPGNLALDVLSSLEGGAKRRIDLPARVGLLDYRFLELMGPMYGVQVLDKAEPALLVALSNSGDPKQQTAAAEAALRINALTAEAVAEVYRRQPEPAARSGSTPREHTDPVLRRASLFRAIEATQAPELKARLMRALLDDARRSGIQMQTARMLAPLVTPLFPAADNGVLAEAIVEVALAANDIDTARRWAETAASLQHWLALIDITDPQQRGRQRQGLMHLNELAARGRMGPEVLHRLATVLDALDVDVPVGLWEAAGRTPQPVSGYLPETGVLAELAQASRRKDAGHTVLLAIRTLGPSTADAVNILALGDSIRALKRAGLDADARRLGLEALFGLWPRTSGH